MIKEFAALPEASSRFAASLGIQAAVLVMAWPSESLFRLLYDERTPKTLFAYAAALGITTAYFQLRAGAEELLSERARTLAEWAVATPLPIPILVLNYGLGHLLQSLWILLLCAPLLLIATVPSGASASALVGLALGVLVHGTFFRFIGACLYVLFGHLGRLHFVLLRIAGVAIWVCLVVKVEPLSYMEFSGSLSGHLAEGNGSPGDSMAVPLDFVGGYAGMSAGLIACLCLLLTRRRRRYQMLSGQEET